MRKHKHMCDWCGIISYDDLYYIEFNEEELNVCSKCHSDLHRYIRRRL